METAPRSNPRLENFEAKKAEAERAAFEQELYGEAGTTDFTDTDQNPDAEYPEDQHNAKKRVEEADAYERHMEKFANDERSAYDRGLDELESGARTSRAEGLVYDEADAENEAFDAARVAENDAFAEKLANDPRLREIDMVSKAAHDARNKEVDPAIHEDDVRRMQELDDRLQELLLRYADSPNYDPAVADLMIDRDDKGALDRAAKKALEDRNQPEAKEELSYEEAMNALNASHNEALDANEASHDEARETLGLENSNTSNEATSFEVETETDEAESEGSNEEGPGISETTGTATEEETPEVPETEETSEAETSEETESTEAKEVSSEPQSAKEKWQVIVNRGLIEFKSLKEKLANKLKGKENSDRRKAIGVVIGGVALIGAAWLNQKYGWIDASDMPDMPDFDGSDNPKPESVPAVPEFSEAAQTVVDGEGFYQTMKEIGLPQSEWTSRLNEVGPDLVDKGAAYWDPAAQEYRISATGRLSPDVLELIKNGK